MEDDGEAFRGLERLEHDERLAFVLHDVFAVPFEDIATIVERSPAAARQLASRARRRVQGADRDAPTADRKVVDAFVAAKAFFAELGMELEGQTLLVGPWVDSTVGLDGVRADVAMMRTPDGHGRLELAKFHTPPAVRAEPENAPANALGIRRIMFAVDDIDDVVARLRRHGAELVGEIAQYEDSYRLCFVRGPEGFIIGLAEQLS